MTWPTILHLTGGIPGDGFDGWQNYWNLWWVKKALLVLGTTPFFTDYLYPPSGASLLFHTLNIFNALWTLPIQLNFGLAIAYNSVVFFSFVFAGYGGYLLSLYTLTRLNFPSPGRLRWAAFAGGLIFTMSPFHFAHLLGHMQVFSLIWPPFYVLWLLRTLEPWAGLPSPPPSRQIEVRNIALACLFLALATLVDWYHTLYLLIFTGLTLLWTLARRWSSLSQLENLKTEKNILRITPHVSRFTFQSQRPPMGVSEPKAPYGRFTPLLRPLWLVLAVGLGFALILSPLLIPMIRAARSTPELQTGLEQSITLSADLLAFITPSEMHPLWGQWAKTVAANFSSTTSERLIFVGFVPLALSIFSLIRGWPNLIVKFWALLTVVFFTLALGPYLHIGGQIITVGDWPVPLPYLLLYKLVPFISLTRSLSRYTLMIMLSLGVLTAIAIASLQLTFHASRFTFHVSHFTFPWLPFLATFLICFEFLPIPYPISKIDTPQFYVDIAAQPEDYTIAELPMNWDRPTPMLYQTAHGKRLLTAYTSRDNPLELAWRTPVFQHWRYLSADIIDQPLALIAPTIFFDFNLRYIVLDFWQMPPGPEREATEKWVAAALPKATPVYDDGRLRVYQSPPKVETQPYLTLGNGWSKRQEHGDGAVSRTLLASAASPPELFLHHPQNRALILEITAAAEQGPQQLRVVVDDQQVDKFQVTETFSDHLITLPLLDGDWAKLSFQTDSLANPVLVKRLSLKQE